MSTKTLNKCTKCDKPGVFVYSRIDDGSHPSIVCAEHILTVNEDREKSDVPAVPAVPEPVPPAYMGGFYAEIAEMRANRIASYAAITDSLKASSNQSKSALVSELEKMKAEREARYAKLLGDIHGGIQSESITRQLNTFEITGAIEAKKEERVHYTIMAALDAEEAVLLEKINKS